MKTMTVPQNFTVLDDDAARAALNALVRTIESTGGVVLNSDGHPEPEGDRDWIDLGDTYAMACKALGKEPMVVPDDENL
jgi:hypothetical protein